MVAIAWFVTVGPSVGLGPAELAAQQGCTVGYIECGEDGHECPSCSELCEMDCGIGFEWDGKTPDPNCYASGPGNCDPWCGLEENCYLKSCGCNPPETK